MAKDETVDEMVEVEDATGDVTETTEVDEDAKIAVYDGAGELVPLGASDISTVEELLGSMRTLAVNDSEEIAARLAAKKLAARSVEELNSLGTLGSIEDVANIPVIVKDLRWNESRIAGSRGAYAVFEAVNTYTGEVTTIGTGHMDVMITLYKAQEWSLLPCRMLFAPAANPNRYGKQTFLAQILPQTTDS
jgi:hypothetical protein